MALIKCPECGKDVSTEAESCPNCGHPIKTAVLREATIEPASNSERNEKEGKGHGCLGTFIAGLICVMLLHGIGMACSSSDKEEYNTEIWAKTYAELMVKDNLKSPSTAKFCNSAREMTAKNLGGSKWRVTGWVDSQNSFGATVRSDFVVTLTLTEKGATCNDISIKTR